MCILYGFCSSGGFVVLFGVLKVCIVGGGFFERGPIFGFECGGFVYRVGFSCWGVVWYVFVCLGHILIWCDWTGGMELVFMLGKDMSESGSSFLFVFCGFGGWGFFFVLWWWCLGFLVCFWVVLLLSLWLGMFVFLVWVCVEVCLLFCCCGWGVWGFFLYLVVCYFGGVYLVVFFLWMCGGLLLCFVGVSVSWVFFLFGMGLVSGGVLLGV